MKYIIRLLSFVYRALQYCKRRASLASAIEHGLVMGSNTRIIGDVNFGTEPYLINIGNNCLITDGVRFITHDGGIQVPFIKKGLSMSEIYGKKVLAGTISIGSNVFIGNGSIILPGTCIGDNVLVGAGSVLKGEYPSNNIVAGTPARIICSIDDYFYKNHEKVIDVKSSNGRARRDAILFNLNRQ